MISVFKDLDKLLSLYNHIIQILFTSIKVMHDKAISGGSLVENNIILIWGTLFIYKLRLFCTWWGTLINATINFEDM